MRYHLKPVRMAVIKKSMNNKHWRGRGEGEPFYTTGGIISGCVLECPGVSSDGIPVEQFQILKDDAVKVLHSICQQIWKAQQCPQDWKRSVFIPVPKKGNAKECSNYHTVALFSHVCKECSKFSKLGFNNMWTENFQMFKLGLEVEEPEIKLQTSFGS